MDGYELIAADRAIEAAEAATIPAVALTAFARSEDRTRALRAGYQAHVAKPVEPGELRGDASRASPISSPAAAVARAETGRRKTPRAPRARRVAQRRRSLVGMAAEASR